MIKVKYQTGKKCIVKDCNEPAGTVWSPYWCSSCNQERLKKISKNLNEIIKKLEKKDG